MATLIHMGGTLEDMKELNYVMPLFGTARDIVNQAALGGSEHPTRTVQTGTRIQGKGTGGKGCFYRRREGRRGI